MGVQTKEMTRLCGEIGTLRGARQTLLADLRRTTQLRRVGVSQMRVRFSETQAVRARCSRADLTSFLFRLRMAVGQLRLEVRAEIAAARRAWLGIVPAEPRGIQVPAPEGVAQEAEPEREEAEVAHEIPEEATDPGLDEGEAGAAAAETRLRKKRKKKR